MMDAPVPSRGASIQMRHSTSSTSSTGSILPRFRSSGKPYYLERGGHRAGTELEEEDDEEGLIAAYLDLPHLDSIDQPPLRRRTLTSPDPNDYKSWLLSEKATSVDTLVPILQRTSARFTQKFPEMAVRRLGASVDGIQGSYGVEGVRRWTGFKWVLMFSVTTVRGEEKVVVNDRNQLKGLLYCQVFLMGLSGLLLTLYTWFAGKNFHFAHRLPKVHAFPGLAWPGAPIVLTVEYNTLACE